MHTIQEKILKLLNDQGSTSLRYREIGRKIGEKYPQTVKHHIERLKDQDLISIQNGFMKLVEVNNLSLFHTLPFYGLANCGAATIFAENRIKGFIKISKSIFPNKDWKQYFIIQASGNSMDQATIGSQKLSISDGDFVIIDSKQKAPKNGDYILSVIDDCANIKKFNFDSESQQIKLLSESSDEYFPIILHESDHFDVMGTVVNVIKRP